MFTGIIEKTGLITEVIEKGGNRSFWVYSPFSKELKIDQSVSHDGVCLTVDDLRENHHRVTAIEETLKKTNLANWKQNDVINLERCLQLNGRLDGHLVQGHVDTTGTCLKKVKKHGSWEFTFQFPKKFAALIIEKGSICVNGISLTAFQVKNKRFTVAIIPYTFDHTNLQFLNEGDPVNLEFDLIGKYLVRKSELKN